MLPEDRDPAYLWDVASERIPELIALLEPLIPSLPPEIDS